MTTGEHHSCSSESAELALDTGDPLWHEVGGLWGGLSHALSRVLLHLPWCWEPALPGGLDSAIS